MKQPTPQEALSQLYQASRLANLTAEQHQFLTVCAQVINAIISPEKKEEAKKD